MKIANNTAFLLHNETGGHIDGKPLGKIYWLSFEDPNNSPRDAVEIYWVDYQGDSSPPITMLGNNANFMFTAMMSGCSLGIGSVAGAGIVGVCHANAARSGDKANAGLTGEAAFRQQKNVQQHMLFSEDAGTTEGRAKN